MVRSMHDMRMCESLMLQETASFGMQMELCNLTSNLLNGTLPAAWGTMDQVHTSTPVAHQLGTSVSVSGYRAHGQGL